MKQRFVWVLTLLLGLLLVVAASCAPAATPAPTPAPAPATPTTTDTTNSVPAIPPISMQRQRTSGTISKINGDILTLTTAQGQVTVKISSDNTTIQNVTTGTRADLRVGAYLMAIGPQDANGNISATSIMIRPQSQGVPPAPPDAATRANPTSPRTGARRGVSGTLTKINGNTLTLTTTQGPMTVNISSDNTTIQNFMTGTIADLHEGQSLNVMGPQDANGNVSANYIIIQPQGRGTTPTPPSGS